MKKQALSFLLFALTLQAGAQIPNSGFESLNPNGTIKNWGALFMTAVTIDSNGVAHSDSIVFDQALYFPTADAHSGQRALEMRNAYNYTSNQPIGGLALVSPNDSDYSAFTSPISINQQPLNFTFFYKFLPAGNDTAFAHMELTDSSGNIVGESIIEIAAAASAYALASKPVTYYTPGPAAFIGITFRTAKPGSTPVFGTRFLVDDVNSVATGIQSLSSKNMPLRCFPNPAENLLNLELNTSIGGGSVQVTDVNGRLLTESTFTPQETVLHIDVSAFSKGVYSIRVLTNKTTYHTQFIK